MHVFRLARLSGDVKGIPRLDVVIIFFQNTILYHGFVSLVASNYENENLFKLKEDQFISVFLLCKSPKLHIFIYRYLKSFSFEL